MKEHQTQGLKIQPQAGSAQLPAPTICCQHCQQKASFFVSCVNGQGKVHSQAFCAQHALKEGILHPRKWELLGSAEPLHRSSETSCACGMTENILKAKGRVGCARCYKTFEKQLKAAAMSVQPGIVHAGKTPVRMTPIADVRRQVRILEMVMQRAIKKESYEQAAVCRDRIRELTQAKV